MPVGEAEKPAGDLTRPLLFLKRRVRSGDGIVSVVDLLALLGQYDPTAPIGCTGGSCDFNGDGCVDVVDLLKLLGHYDRDGAGCP